ncbi:hypothetical protein Q2317_24260, partial [Escherichia coli]|nr:hypothetical protein [Escherichia coli]
MLRSVHPRSKLCVGILFNMRKFASERFLPVNGCAWAEHRRSVYGIGFSKQFISKRGGGPMWYA